MLSPKSPLALAASALLVTAFYVIAFCIYKFRTRGRETDLKKLGVGITAILAIYLTMYTQMYLCGVMPKQGERQSSYDAYFVSIAILDVIVLVISLLLYDKRLKRIKGTIR